MVSGSYEALEGNNIYITDGAVDLASDDDAINAAGGSGNGTDGRGGFFGRDMFTGGDHTIDISGGKIKFFAGGDGLDSNGTINISGGAIEAIIGSTPDNSAVDSDGATTVTGGLLIAGGTGTFGNLSDASTQSYVYLAEVSAGDEVTVHTGQETLASYTADRELSSLAIFASGILSGQNYDVSMGGVAAEVTAGTGGVGMGFGGPGGGPGGRGGRDGQFPVPPEGGERPSDGVTPSDGATPPGDEQAPPEVWMPPDGANGPDGPPPEGWTPLDGANGPGGPPPEGWPPPDGANGPDGTPPDAGSSES
jgi:hypothetical protein